MAIAHRIPRERAHILHVLAQTRWKVHGESGAASIMGTLQSRMKKLGIKRPKGA